MHISCFFKVELRLRIAEDKRAGICYVYHLRINNIENMEDMNMNSMIWLITGLVLLVPAMVVFFYHLGKWIYKDAKSRGMRPGLWTVIGLSGQNMGGFLIYLLSRKSKKEMETEAERKCVRISCGAFIIMNLGIICCIVYIINL